MVRVSGGVDTAMFQNQQGSQCGKTQSGQHREERQEVKETHQKPDVWALQAMVRTVDFVSEINSSCQFP